ncbi:MAG: DNA topoisomerase I [Candidatus Chisholmbacteria bacterium RIFCSPLOWO2_01_FULL_50_28]|uniref:DNA topoisomerase 1 n=1 Tax=Candidatus Chisholmbacteria bacterium RIFCSPHIGHO2_01_FULL_52_32 TaxID=1797591 RepID=A0A1G1VSB9_9BACT|nr:MAG: DNA topoisomerase I [Candidatus Chisholmbacteria bacterium RIFCSPHIGHO2_01_FULL_52_32]OGY20412.1 MAG: DNA topoisomerase I [Candidatus Chisholmbacteria bacterium RIFCSPLOWO2_01_FULL_50_28]
MKLVIVESPTKARTLSRFLGKGYQIEASMGHVRDLPKKKLSVDVEHDFAPDYAVVPEKEKIVRKLKEAAKKASEIFLSMDPDREGEAIAFHVKHLIGGNGKFRRVVFHEITKPAIEAAFLKPRGIDKNLVEAQQGRRVLDRLVGYTLSPLLWRKVRRGLSAGRVQSVAVRLIVEREREIEAFVPEEYWVIGADVSKLTDPNSVFTVWLWKIDGGKAKVSDVEQAKTVVSDLESSNYTISSVERKEVRKHPYPPFTTSTLQQSASNLFHMTAKQTMRLAQTLYELGHITYHRTDSVHLAPEAVAAARSFIQKTYGDAYLPEKPRFYKVQSKLAQEAHEAIRPTHVEVEPDALDFPDKAGGGLRRLYQLIHRRFVASQMADAVYDQTTVEVITHSKLKTQNLKVYLLRAVGSLRKFDGWKKLFGKNNDEQQFPELVTGEGLNLVKVLSEQKFTEPPSRYTDATLVKALEERGIGRPSTYAPTISTILARQYVTYDERKFVPTPVGIAANDFLVGNFDTIVDYDFTASMEDDLDKIADGKREWVPVIREFWGPFHSKAEAVAKNAKRVKVATEATGEKCPVCHEGDVVIRVGRFGKFLSCSRFPECKYTANYVEKLAGVKCPLDDGDVVIKRTRRGKQFYGCSNYPKCKWASWRKPTPPTVTPSSTVQTS